MVPNPDGALKLEMFAKIGIASRERREGLVVPQAAIQQIENQPVVFVRQSDTRFERRAIRLGASGGDVVEVDERSQARRPGRRCRELLSQDRAAARADRRAVDEDRLCIV